MSVFLLGGDLTGGRHTRELTGQSRCPRGANSFRVLNLQDACTDWSQLIASTPANLLILKPFTLAGGAAQIGRYSNKFC